MTDEMSADGCSALTFAAAAALATHTHLKRAALHTSSAPLLRAKQQKWCLVQLLNVVVVAAAAAAAANTNAKCFHATASIHMGKFTVKAGSYFAVGRRPHRVEHISTFSVFLLIAQRNVV